PQVAVRLEALDDLRQGLLALRRDDVDIRANILDGKRKLIDMVTVKVIRYQRPTHDDFYLLVMLSNKFDHVDDRQVEHIECRRYSYTQRVLRQICRESFFFVLE